MPGISRDREKARRQLAGLARTNPLLAARLERGELPGYKGPLEGTEHLHPDAPPPTPPTVEPAAVAPPSPAEPGTVPGTAPQPGNAGHVPGIQVGRYDDPPAHGPNPHPEPDPDPAPGADPTEPTDAPAAQRGPLGQLVDGFLGRV